jgi:hypothetical protein
MEKFDIIMTIYRVSNAQFVLDQLHESCNPVDVTFVKIAGRHSVNRIFHSQGNCFMLFEISFESVLTTFCANLKGPQGTAALIWSFGE